jgi:hypothetical protein
MAVTFLLGKIGGGFVALLAAIAAAAATTWLEAPWDIAAAVLASIMGAVSLLLYSVRRTVARRSSCTPSA